MKTEYVVTLEREVTQNMTVEVTAESEAQACVFARAQANLCPGRWVLGSSTPHQNDRPRAIKTVRHYEVENVEQVDDE